MTDRPLSVPRRSEAQWIARPLARICSGNVDAVGAPRITPEGREILLRLTTGDLMDDFQAALDADPVLGGHDTDDQA